MDKHECANAWCVMNSVNPHEWCTSDIQAVPATASSIDRKLLAHREARIPVVHTALFRNPDVALLLVSICVVNAADDEVEVDMRVDEAEELRDNLSQLIALARGGARVQ